MKGSIKHNLYNKFKNKNGKLDEEIEKELYTIFGPENGEDYASAIGFTDAKLLFFPIKSVTDIFKLVTCPYVIKRWVEDLKLADKQNIEDFDVNNLDVSKGRCIISNDEEEEIVLEEYIFKKEDSIDGKLQDIFKNIGGLNTNRIVILNDTDFVDLVTMYTEIITRNRIDVKTGAAEGTGFFTEEYLPAETVLYFIVLASPSFNKNNGKTSQEVLTYFNNNIGEVFQVGGNAIIGKGFVKRIGKVGVKGE